jgi:glycosyltransferase involved in cell wall biosynthesis
MRRGMPNPLAAARLLRIVREIRPQILQTWMYHADLLGLLVGKLAGVPAIAWNIRCSAMEMGHYRRLSMLVLRALVPLSSRPQVVIANSQSGIRVHRALGYTPRRWLYLPNSLDLEKFQPDPSAGPQVKRELRVSQNARLIGLIARFDPMKDHANFVNAAKLMTASDPDLHFVLAGIGVDSRNAELMRLVESTAVPHHFHLLGHRDDIGHINAGLDIACSSSAFGEGSSNAVAEAMACGVPCVVTDVGDSAFIVQNLGKVVAARDSQAFARACRELLDLSPEQRSQLGLAARERVEECFPLRPVVARYEELYQELSIGDRKFERGPSPCAEVGQPMQ